MDIDINILTKKNKTKANYMKNIDIDKKLKSVRINQHHYKRKESKKRKKSIDINNKSVHPPILPPNHVSFILQYLFCSHPLQYFSRFLDSFSVVFSL